MIVGGREYELKYTIGKIELIENVTGEPVITIFSKAGGFLTISALKIYVAYGLKEVGTDKYLPVSEGLKEAEKLIEENGYTAVNEWVMTAVNRDCPFFFRAV